MQTVKRPTDDVRRQIAILMLELQALRDDTKVHMHFAGMELRDRWNRFELRHVQLQEAARHVREDALEALRNALVDHRAKLTELRDDLESDPEC